MKLKWHLPKWAVDYPEAGPIRRTVNFAEMGPAEMSSFALFIRHAMMPQARGFRTDSKRFRLIQEMGA